MNQNRPVGKYQAGQFPACVSEVLCQVTSFIRTHGNSPLKGLNRAKAKELQVRIDTDLFCLSNDRRTSRLNPLQRLRLLGIVCTYFSKEVSKEQNPQLRYLHFDMIFCGREGEAGLHEARINFLTKLSVLALQFPVYHLFEDIALWLNKVSSGKTRSYAEQIVNEIVQEYILIPEHYQMHAFMAPLNRHSFDFVAYFVVYSVKENTICPSLIDIIGLWLSEAINNFLHIVSLNLHLTDAFSTGVLDSMLYYDSMNIYVDESHHRFHFVVISLITNWKRYFGSNRRPSFHLFTNYITNSHNKEIILAKERLLENIQNCICADFLSKSIYKYIPVKFIPQLYMETETTN